MSGPQRIKVDNIHNIRKPNSSSHKGPGGPNQNAPYTRPLKFMPEGYERLNACSHGRSSGPNQEAFHAPTFECMPGRYRRPNICSHETPIVFNQNVSEFVLRIDSRQNTRSYECYSRSQHVFRTSSLCFIVDKVHFKKVIF